MNTMLRRIMKRIKTLGNFVALFATAVQFLFNAEYVRMDFNIRTSTDNRTRVLYGLSLQKCIYECGRRPDCQRLNYMRARRECGLYNSTNSRPADMAHSCVVITREELDPDQQLGCDCKIGMACQTNGSCQYEECPPIPPMDPARGSVDKGNMLNIGAKVRRGQCNEGYTMAPDNPTSFCGNSGQWIELPKCLLSCSEPCPRLPYTSNVSPGGYLEGDTRNYTCMDGLYVNGTSGSQNVTIVCTDDGWDYGEVSSQLCVSDTFHPKRPENIVRLDCYLFEVNPEKKTSAESQSECEPYGDLLRVDSISIQSVLNKYLAYDWNGPYWIQGKRTSGWIFDDGTAIQLLWWTVSLSSLYGNCLTIEYPIYYQVLRWGARSCDEMHNFICEYETI